MHYIWHLWRLDSPDISSLYFRILQITGLFLLVLCLFVLMYLLNYCYIAILIVACYSLLFDSFCIKTLELLHCHFSFLLKYIIKRKIKVFIIESYFRNGTKVIGVRQYSLQFCLQKFQPEYPQMIVFITILPNSTNSRKKLFRLSGSVAWKRGSDRSKRLRRWWSKCDKQCSELLQRQ